MPDNQIVSHSQYLIRKNHFHFIVWFNLRLNNFLLKLIKFQSNKQQSVVSPQFCHNNGIPKMAKIVCRQMPAPRELSQQIPAPPPPAKGRMQKPQGGDKYLVQIPGGARGGMVMDEIDTCIKWP